MEGWIKLHRAFLEWQWFSNYKMVSVFIYCLLKANHNGKFWQTIEINRGSFITSLDHISVDTGLSVHVVRNCLDKLKQTKEIEVKTTNKFTLITICKYDTYQQENAQKESERANNGQTTGKQRATNKNDKNDNNLITWKNDFEIYKNECLIECRKLYNDKEFIAEQSHLNPNVNVKLSIEKAIKNYWETEAAWDKKRKDKKLQKINWKSTMKNAISSPMNRTYLTKQEQEPKPMEVLHIEDPIFNKNKPY